VSEPKLVPVSGRKTPANGIAGIWSWQPDGDLIGTVVYVHGMFDSADTAWKGTLGTYAKDAHYKRPDGKPLKTQFEESGVKALFLVPEAEIHSDNGSEVVWNRLQDLLAAAGAKGPVVALSHSAGYHTVYDWLTSGDLVHISLIDSMWGYEEAYSKWLKKDGHSIDLIGAGPTPRKFFADMVTPYPDKVEDRTPPRKLSDPAALQAKVLWMKDPYDHMNLIADGKLIPPLLRRAEAALLRAAGKAARQAQAKMPAPKVFEAGSGDDHSHVVDHGLQSELKDVPDLAQMAALHHLVLKPGTTRADAVKAVQRALKKCIGAKCEETGKYDSDTARAVQDFQAEWNKKDKDPQLDVDSRLGAHTLLALDQALFSPSPAAPSAAPQVKQAGHGPTTQGRYPLSTDGAKRFSTKLGNFYRFAKPNHVTNQHKRPAFWRDGGLMIEYKGPGSDPVAAGSEHYSKSHRLIHPVLVEPLTRMLSAMVEEGKRIDDESLKRPSIGSGWRSFEQDGAGFLKQLRKQIGKHKETFGDLTFPAALEKEAQSNLYGKEEQFVSHLAAQPGWSHELANKLYNWAKGAKAPGGLSTHESGLTVDIDFPYATSESHVKFHQITTENNADAHLSAAGIWLAQYGQSEFHFSSYNTAIEIWHMEWLDWKDTDADPNKSKAS
jgi:hypothetical protein